MRIEKGRKGRGPRLCTVAIATATLGLAACSGTPDLKPGQQGVNAGEASELRKLVPADSLEKSAAAQYATMMNKASGETTLAGDNDPQVKRLRAIAKRIIPHAPSFNGRARSWNWEVNLVRSDNINAFCMPGGKIAFYSGILEKLQLTDDEVGVIMGHEMAHALREHSRTQIAKSTLTNAGASIVSTTIGGSTGSLIKSGAGLLNLKYSRDHETDADLVGLELAARAGFDPRAGVTLWQKMAAASQGAPSEWFSTHPSNQSRIATIKTMLPAVMPLYKKAKKKG